MSDFAKQILPINIEDELKTSYLSYAMSVIHGRALPDVFFLHNMSLEILIDNHIKNLPEW